MTSANGRPIFGNKAGQLEGFSIGETHGVAAKLSEMASAVNRNSALLDPPSKVDRLLIPVVRMFKLKGSTLEDWDYVHGNTWDGTTRGSDDIRILKPWFLRGTFWNDRVSARVGIRYEQFDDAKRTASKSGEDDETQWIIPSYEINDVIFAISNVYGGFETQTVDPASKDALWMDLNVDGRMWAKV